jgi:hypothetical protein
MNGIVVAYYVVHYALRNLQTVRACSVSLIV